MAGGNMGDLWFTLGVRSNIASTVNKALKELKDVDGAISVLNRKYVEAQENLRSALSAQKVDKNLVKSLNEEVKAWSKGVDNALAYQGMLQKVKKELDNISNLKKLNVGVDTTKLSEAETLLRNFRKDLTQVTYEKLGGTDANDYLSKYRKALGLTLNDVKSKVESFRKDNSLTDAANRTATLERSLANIQKRLLDIRALQSEAYRGNYNSSNLLSAGNRLRGVERRIQKMIADPDLLNSESKYRTLISDIGTAASKAALDIEKYNTSKKKAQDARITSDKDKQALDDTIERFSKLRSILSEGLNVRRGGNLTDEEVNRLNLGLQGLVQKVLELRSAINSGKGASNLFNSGNDKVQINDLEQLIRLYQKLNTERERDNKSSLHNYSENYGKAVSALTKVNELLGKTYEARNRGMALGMDTTRLEKDIQTLRELRAALEILKNNPSDAKGVKVISADTEARLANILKHIKDINSNMGAARARTNEAAAAARELASAFERAHSSASKSSNVLNDIKSLFLQGGIVFGAQQIFNSIVKTGGEIEQQHIALQSILGDVSKANELFDQTKRLALESPFTFGELNRDVKQLAAFGVDTDNLYDTTKRLADVAAGLGVSFERLGLAYGQVKSRSWLDGKELRQFAYAGLPMLQKLADYYNSTRKDKTYTTRDVRDMITKREVSFEDVDAVFKRLTDEGGQFYNLQYVLSETLLGQFNKLKDAWDIMLGELASGNSLVGKFFKTGIQLATAFVQSIDKLGPVMAAAFSGFAAKKLMTAIGGTAGSSILSAKGSIAQDLRNRLMMGEQLNASEMRILRTKGMITAKDMEILIKAGQITKQDLRRLYITGQINTALYKQSMAMTGLVTKSHGLSVYWRAFMMRLHGFNLATFGSALFGSIKSGIGGLAKGLWGLIGGLPGAMITAGTMLVAKIYQSKQEMQDAIDRINEEQNARYKDIDDFLSKNPADKAKSGTDEDRIAAVENYKEKLKEVAPYNVAAFEMSMSEKKSHEQRIDYLSQELKLVRDANDYNTRHSENLTKGTKGDFEDTADKAKDLEETYGIIEKRLGQLHINDIQNALPRMAQNANTRPLAQELNQAIKNGETLEQLIVRIKQEVFSANGEKNYKKSGVDSFVSGIFGNGIVDGYNLPNGADKYIADYYDQTKAFKKQVDKLKDTIKKEMPNVGKDPTVTEAYKQFRESLEGQMQLSPEEKEMINISLDDAFGIENNDLQVKFADKLRDTIDQTIPDIAAKIRSGQELTQADKDKVDELMKTAEQELEIKYPNLRDKLQSLLDKSHFQATIHLAFDGDEWNDLQKRFYNNLPSILNDKRKYQLSNIANSWTNDNSMYSARNAAKSAIDQAKNELKAEQDALSKGKSTQAIVNKKKQDLQDMKDAALYGLGYDYDGELKKSNKPPKADHSAEIAKRKAEAAARKADQDDEKRLRARLQLINDAYETYKKYYELLHNENEAAKVVSAQYKDKGLSNEDVAKIKSEAGYRSLTEDAITDIRNWQPRRPSEMKERKDELIASGVKQLNNIDYNSLQEQMKEFASSMNRDLDEMSRKWSNYNSLYKSTGDADLAARISGISGDLNGIDANHYNDGAANTGYVQNYSDYIRNYLDDLILQSKHPDKAIDYDKLYGMSDKEIENYAGELFGADDKEKIEGFTAAFKELKKTVTDTEFKEALETFGNLMEQIVTQEAQQARITASHTENLNRLATLRSEGKISQNDYDKAKAVEDADFNDKQLKASDEYKQFTDNVISMTSKMANKVKKDAIDALDQKLKAGSISAKDYADQVAAINDKMGEFADQQSDLQVLFTSGIDGWLQHQRQSALSDMQYGALLLNADPTSKEGKNALESGKKKYQKYIENQSDVKSWSNLDKVVQGVAAAFNNLIGVLQPLIDTASTFGNKGIAEGVGIASKSIQSGVSVSDSMSGLAGIAKGMKLNGVASALGKAGPYGAAAAAALSIGNSLLNKFGFGAAANKRYEKQEKYYKQMISTMQDINSNLENRVSDSYGSRSIEAARKLVANYGAQAGEARDTYQDWSQAHTLHRNHRNRLYVFGGREETNDYFNQINDFLRQNGYTGSNVGGDTIQNLDAKWLKLIKEDMPDAWAHMNEEAQGYLNTIIEMEGDTEKLKEANDKLNEALTGMSFDGMKSEYESILDDLDSDNDDLADSLEKKLRGAILNSMISNLYKDQIEKAISDTADLAKNEEYVDKYGNIKRHTLRDSKGNLTYGENDIASEYTADEYQRSRSEMDGITDDMKQTRDMLKDLYGWSDKNSSSMSSSIKGTSEETSDLLASYANAMRADISVIRLQFSLEIPKLNLTATAQLQQLNMINENTRRNADAAEVIRDSVNNLNDMFTRGFNGTKPLHVDVK